MAKQNNQEPKRELTANFVKFVQPAKGINKKRYSDAGTGLYLVVLANGNKYFITRYTYQNKQCELHLGTYPAISLQTARDKSKQIKEWTKTGINPKLEFTKVQRLEESAKQNTVKKVCLDFMRKKEEKAPKPRLSTTRVTPAYMQQNALLERYIFPKLGDRLLDSISTTEWRVLLESIKTPMGITAMKLKTLISSVYNHAILCEITDRNPITPLNRFFSVKPTTHRLAITDQKELSKFLLAVEKQKESKPQSYYAIWLNFYTWLRPTENISLRWDYWDKKNHWLKVPAENMKQRKNESPHYVPLAPQAEQLLLEIERFNRITHKPNNGYIFPSRATKDGFLDGHSIGYLIKVSGYKGKQTIHGIRTTVRTMVSEKLGAEYREPGERQLDHANPNPTEASYSRSDFLDKRRKMLVEMAKILDTLKPKQNKTTSARPRNHKHLEVKK